MKRVSPFLFACLIIACDNSQSSHRASTETIDSFTKARMVDSMVKNVIKDATLKDTAAAADAPVRVIKAWLADREYSSYRDIYVKYKNVSGKKIEAIKFQWYGETAFGDPADMGGIMDGVGGGFTDSPIGNGKTRTDQYSIMSRNAKKVVKAWAFEVAFSDGTKWKLKE